METPRRLGLTIALTAVALELSAALAAAGGSRLLAAVLLALGIALLAAATTRRLGMPWWPLGSAAVLVVALASVVAAGSTPGAYQSRIGAAGQMTHRNWTVEMDPRLTEISRELGDIARRSGIPAAHARLRVLEAQEDLMPQFTHLLSHEVGRYAYGTYYRDHLEAMSTCGTGYQFGCVHGVMEAYFETGPSFSADRINEVCGSSRGRSDEDWVIFGQCLHGLGHAIMDLHEHDIFASLPVCDALDSEMAASYCRIAVTMANNVQLADQLLVERGILEPHAHTPHPSFFDRADLNYPCNAVDPRYRSDCYGMHPAGLLYLTNNDFDAVMRACDEAEEAHRARCHWTLAREMAGAVGYVAAKAHAVCLRVNERYRTECYGGAAQNLTTGTQRPADAHPLCRLAADPYKPRCYLSIGQNLRDFFPDPAEQRRQCEPAEPAYVATCLEGALRGVRR